MPRSVADPLSTNVSCVDATLNLLIAARAAGVRRVIYAASSAAYGDTPTLPKHEEMLPAPITPYAVAKLACEHYLACFTRVYGLETVSLRYFNVFGPYQDPTSHYSGVLAIFCRKMLAGEQPTIYGDGEQSRDFTYIDNVVAGNLLAAEAPCRKSGRQNDEPGHWPRESRSTRPSKSSRDSPATTANRPTKMRVPETSRIRWPTFHVPKPRSATSHQSTSAKASAAPWSGTKLSPSTSCFGLRPCNHLRREALPDSILRMKTKRPGADPAIRKARVSPQNVDQYLAATPEPARAQLVKMRAAIRSVLPPETTEVISYKIPAFKLKKILVWFAAFKDHCSLFPTAAILQQFKTELAGYKTSKGTVQFPLDKPLPVPLIKKLVKARLAASGYQRPPKD